MNNDVELYIRQNTAWLKLPSNIKQSLGNSQKEYEKHIVNFSVKNQLRYRGNLVRQVRKDERRYYEEVLHYSRTGLLLYPYHLSDIMVEGLRVTPFQYYTSVLESIMDQERSYDSLPNFTAADCLRLLGIGRNEYIDLMNQCRSGRKLFRRKNVKDLLPSKPKDINIEPWWLVAAGCIVEEDIKLVSEPEKELIDRIIDHGKQRAGDLNMKLVHLLYKKGLIYLEVPIDESDYIVVPPLEGFVMNRVLGDYFETLLYKIFVSIDEHTSVGELANVLQIEPQSVKNAVSLYCRLGFARKKCTDTDDWHPSWKPSRTVLESMSPEVEDPCVLDLGDAIADVSLAEEVKPTPVSDLEDSDAVTTPRSKRICFLFDSTLTAFLMMGNLSPGLKSHAVTMFEVGKLLDESLDGFLSELEKVSTARDDSEGEARRYFEHALILRSTILALRHGTSLHDGLDLVRCESLYPLEPDTLSRLLAKNYSLLVSMAPLSKEVRPISSQFPPHLGPASADVNTIWFKMFLYHITKDGPPSLLFTRGTRVRKLPRILRKYDKVMVTSWGHDPTVIPLTSFLFAVNDALLYSPVLAQAYGYGKGAETRLVPFPLESKDNIGVATTVGCSDSIDWKQHQGVLRLSDEIDLVHTCGYVTMVRLARSDPPPATSTAAGHTTSGPSTSTKPLVAESQPSYSPERPKNGFHSKECADILTQELDDLSDPRPVAGPSHRPDTIHVPKDTTDKQEGAACRQDVPESPVIESKPRAFYLSSWMILDCCFGVPLFEDEVNRRLCATIVNTLAVKESLEKLVESNEQLRTRLQQFISNFYSINKMPSIPEIKSGPLWPRTCLTFHEGRLREWDEK